MAVKVTGSGNPDQSLKGIYVFPPTPTSNGKFDDTVFQHLLDYLIKEGNVHGVATLGSTGNGPAFAGRVWRQLKVACRS
jgi:dihydrodipicolinate synthase/N-acetylneuraminate lyase